MRIRIDRYDIDRMPINGVLDLSGGIGHVARLEATLIDDEGRTVENDEGYIFNWTRNGEPFGKPGKVLELDLLTDIEFAEDVFGCRVEIPDG